MPLAVGRLGAVVAGGDEQEEAHHDLVLLEVLAVDLGVDEHAGQVVGRVLAPLRDQLLAALEDLGTARSMTGFDVGVEVRIAGTHDAFMSRAQSASSSGGTPMKLWMTRETTGCATSVTRSHSSRPSRRSIASTAICRIASWCSAIRFGVKPAWKSS